MVIITIVVEHVQVLTLFSRDKKKQQKTTFSI